MKALMIALLIGLTIGFLAVSIDAQEAPAPAKDGDTPKKEGDTPKKSEVEKKGEEEKGDSEKEQEKDETSDEENDAAKPKEDDKAKEVAIERPAAGTMFRSWPEKELGMSYDDVSNTLGELLLAADLSKYDATKFMALEYFRAEYAGLDEPKGRTAKNAYKSALGRLDSTYIILPETKVESSRFYPKTVRPLVYGTPEGPNSRRLNEGKREEATCIWVNYSYTRDDGTVKGEDVIIAEIVKDVDGNNLWRIYWGEIKDLRRDEKIGPHRIWVLLNSLAPQTDNQKLAAAYLSAMVMRDSMATEFPWWDTKVNPYANQDERIFLTHFLTPFLATDIDPQKATILYAHAMELGMPREDIVEVKGSMMSKEMKDARDKKVKEKDYKGILDPKTVDEIYYSDVRRRFTKFYREELKKQ